MDVQQYRKALGLNEDSSEDERTECFEVDSNATEPVEEVRDDERILEVVDMSSTEFNIKGKSMFLCFDGLFETIDHSLVKNRGYPATALLNGNIADDENKTLLFGLAGSPAQYAMSFGYKHILFCSFRDSLFYHF